MKSATARGARQTAQARRANRASSPSTTGRKASVAVYDAVTRGDVGQAIRKLPGTNQARFRQVLEGVQLPEREKHRVRFLNELADLAARLLENNRSEVERATGLMSRRGYCEGVIRHELEAIERTFNLIREIALVSMRSSKPSDYVRLMSRPGVDVERLVSTMGFFAGDRIIKLKHLDMEQRRVALEMERLARESTSEALRALVSLIADHLRQAVRGTRHFSSDWSVLQAFDIASVMARNTRALERVLRKDHAWLIRDKSFFQLDEMAERIAKAKESKAVIKYTHDFLITCGIYQTDTGQMLRFGKMFKEGPIEGYVVLRPQKLRSYGYEGMTTADIDDPTALLASDTEHTMQHELQHVFDKIVYVESALTSMEDGTGETRRNMLSMEYRARLAEMAFAHPSDLVEESMREVRETIALDESQGESMDIRAQADGMVYQRMGRFKKGGTLKRMARKLLDQAYRQAYGLTYTQIVEPFAHVGTGDANPTPQAPSSSTRRSVSLAPAGRSDSRSAVSWRPSWPARS